jgi:hypothetical protein
MIQVENQPLQHYRWFGRFDFIFIMTHDPRAADNIFVGYRICKNIVVVAATDHEEESIVAATALLTKKRQPTCLLLEKRFCQLLSKNKHL